MGVYVGKRWAEGVAPVMRIDVSADSNSDRELEDHVLAYTILLHQSRLTRRISTRYFAATRSLMPTPMPMPLQRNLDWGPTTGAPGRVMHRDILVLNERKNAAQLIQKQSKHDQAMQAKDERGCLHFRGPRMRHLRVGAEALMFALSSSALTERLPALDARCSEIRIVAAPASRKQAGSTKSQISQSVPGV